MEVGMSRALLLFVMLAIAFGCSGRTFTNLGPGVGGVPSKSIDDYAATHKITRAEAIERMKAEFNQRRIEDHAKKYGTSLGEAKSQIEHSDE